MNMTYFINFHLYSSVGRINNTQNKAVSNLSSESANLAIRTVATP
jgi:hypothetical protein